MVRKARKKQVQSAKMYQHFAVATIGITAVVGILADGEAQQAVAASDAQKEEELRVANAEALSRGNRRQITDEGDVGTGSFGSDVSMGVTTTGYSSSTPISRSIPENLRSVIGTSTVWQRIGLSKSEWESLSDEQREEMAKRLDPLYGKSNQELLSEARRTTEASRIRAGGGASTGNSDAPDVLN